MCGRYEFNIDIKELIEKYNITNNYLENNVYKEIFPTMKVPVIINNKGNNEIRELKWGFDLNLKRPIINARSETVFNKKAFRDSFFSRRCIIPASSFFEWEKIDNKKVKRNIYINEESIISLAGIYSRFKNKEGKYYYAFTILTREASDSMKKVHNRMPIILNKNDEYKWINNSINDIRILKNIIDNSLNEVTIS